MAGVSKTILIGNLGQDPEVKYLQSGDAVASFSLATSETWRDKQTGERKELTEWHRCVAFGRPAEIIGEYARKGSKMYVEGQNRTRKWQGQDGQDRYTTEVRVREFQFLDSRSDGQQTAPRPQGQAPQRQAQPQQEPEAAFYDDDIPF